MAAPTTSHWSNHHAHWSRLGPPLRPHPDVVTAACALLPRDDDGPISLLGVTREYAERELPAPLIAVDRNLAMIAAIWPGDTPSRRVVQADWRQLPLATASCTAALGDGSLSMLRYPHGYRLVLAEYARALRPGGRLIVRLFERPAQNESVADVIASAGHREGENFNAFKWRFAMALATDENPDVEVASIRSRFIEAFPDREAFSQRSGWARADIDTIDVYAQSKEVYSFPSFAELSVVIPEEFAAPRRIPVGSYPLAERCPLLLLERRS